MARCSGAILFTASAASSISFTRSIRTASDWVIITFLQHLQSIVQYIPTSLATCSLVVISIDAARDRFDWARISAAIKSARAWLSAIIAISDVCRKVYLCSITDHHLCSGHELVTWAYIFSTGAISQYHMPSQLLLVLLRLVNFINSGNITGTMVSD